ncbi:MAG: ABC transporter ATP-binding protein [Oscillochloris sp.]|nr:ABC transporter ATP-binding protein [Oscillochloris sp.]
MAFLELTELHKRYPGGVAVHQVNLAVERGEFVSFLGPSGCGKTTTLRMVAGFEIPTSGTIRIDGTDVTRVAPSRRNIGMVFQSYALFPNMRVADNIGFGLRVAGRPANEIRERATELLRLIHMEEFAQRYPAQLSGGQQQRVALARALAIRPRVLLLDEPLSALDARIRVTLRQEIRTIQRQLGITTIYVTHDQEEALSLSDRVVVMNGGRVEQIGPPSTIYNTPQSAFVASFVGTLNLLPARILNRDAGQVAVGDQPVQVHQSLAEPTGSAVTLALRPEIFSLNGTYGPCANQLQAIAEEISFLGSVVRVRARVAEHRLSFDLFNTPGLAPPHPGEPITLHFPPDACLVLPTN